MKYDLYDSIWYLEKHFLSTHILSRALAQLKFGAIQRTLCLKLHLKYVLMITHLPYPSHRTQSTFTCSKLTIETLEQDVKYVQS